MKPVAYEGPEKYIFVSYAHKDSKQVLDILEKMTDMGYRLWYDDGIAPGSEWPENIAQHLDGCALVIAFVSNNSIASSNCRREVTFALAKHKPFLGILLEQTQMSLGMELQLSAQQCIMRYNYRREEDFINKILSCPELADCKAEPEPEPEPASGEQPVIAAPAENPAPTPVKKPEKPSAPPQKVKQPRPKKEKKTNPNRRTVLLAAGGAVLALILAIALTVSLSRVKVAPDLNISKSEESVTLREKEVTAQTVSQLNKLNNLKYLYLYDCALEPGAMSKLEAPALITLTMEYCTGETDFTFLEKLAELRYISLKGCGITDDNFAFHTSSKPVRLELANNPDFSDLSFVDTEKLQHLNVSGTAVQDLSCLSTAQSLTEINCADTPVSDISALAKLRELKLMNFNYCAIERVTEPFLSLSMKEIRFTGNGLTDCSGFENFTVLQYVYLADNALTNIDWLSKSTASLREVSLSGNPLEQEKLGFLGQAYDLTKLFLDGVPMKDLSVARELVLLTDLSAKNCGIEDISHLSLLSNLKELYLSGNAISDLTGLPALGGSSYPVLDLAYNNITDVSAIPGKYYQVLALHGNPLIYTAASFSDMEGYHLSLDYDTSITNCGALSFYEVYLQNCPLDQQLNLTDLLGNGVQYMTHEEILATLEAEEVYY